MLLHKLPIKLQKTIRKYLVTYEKLAEEEIKLFAQELLRNISKDDINKIAREKKFVQRKSKLDALQMLNLCCFDGIDVAKDTLVKVASRITINSGYSISNQAIDQRFNSKCVGFLKGIFLKLLKNKVSIENSVPSELDKYFNRIRILDATSFQLPEDYRDVYPGSGGSAAISGIKIQLEYDLKSGDIVNLHTEPCAGNDNTFGSMANQEIEKNDLIIRDLGYFSIDEFKNIQKKEAFFISRLKPNIATYIKNKNLEYYKNGSPKKSSLFKRFNLKDVMDDMKPGEMIELKDIFIGKEHKLNTRLIVYKLTEKQLEERTKKALKSAKKKGIVKSTNTIDLLGISMYLTNISLDISTFQKIYELYTLRWAIEIIFKIWKSIFHINNIKKVKLDRFECQLYGKLILIILSSSILFKMRKLLLVLKNKEVSEIKLSQVINEYIKDFDFLCNECFSELFEILLKIYKHADKNALKSRKKGKKTAFQIMNIECNSQIKEQTTAINKSA